MKEYDSFENIKNDPSLFGEEVWAFNKLDGQNFRVKYNPRKKEFCDFGSRHCMVDENDEFFGKCVIYFKTHYPVILADIIKKNSGKGGVFNGVEEITFFFEWYGDNSFAGFHKDGDEMHLALIDVFLKKKGYIEPKDFYKMFNNVEGLEIPALIYRGKLTQEFVDSIKNNDWNADGCEYPQVKEGVVAKRSTLLKGQRLPKVKIKTQWWLDKLHSNFDETLWKDME